MTEAVPKAAMPIKKSLKFGMVEEKMPIADKFKMLRDIGSAAWPWQAPASACSPAL